MFGDGEKYRKDGDMSVSSRQHSSTVGVVDIAVTEASALLRQGTQLVDVREPDEFAAGHARGAVNIPLGQLASRVGEIDPAQTVLVICRSGNRSRVACELLAANNVPSVRNVSGGTQSWQSAGLPMGS